VPALHVQITAAESRQEVAPMAPGATLEAAPVGAGSTEASSPIFHVRGLLADGALAGSVSALGREFERKEKAERVSLLRY
jgi:hypothetical protein